MPSTSLPSGMSATAMTNVSASAVTAKPPLPELPEIENAGSPLASWRASHVIGCRSAVMPTVIASSPTATTSYAPAPGSPILHCSTPSGLCPAVAINHPVPCGIEGAVPAVSTRPVGVTATASSCAPSFCSSPTSSPAPSSRASHDRLSPQNGSSTSKPPTTITRRYWPVTIVLPSAGAALHSNPPMQPCSVHTRH